MKKTYIKPNIVSMETALEGNLMFASGGTTGGLDKPSITDPSEGEEMSAKAFSVWE